MNLWVAPLTDREIAAKGRPPAIAIDRLVEGLFRRSGYLALRDASCVALGDALYLRGRLPSYYLKQVAQEVAASVAGASRLINIIEVCVSTGRVPASCDRRQRPAKASR